MKILFDFQLNPENDGKPLTPLFNTLLEEIKEYIEGRLSVFKDDMEKNETYFGSFVLLNVLSENGISIGFMNYATSLSKKMQSVITDDDYAYLNRRLSDIADSFLN